MSENSVRDARVGTRRLNRLALASVGCTVIALAGVVGLGVVAVAVFAVGAGHVALQQIAVRGERGAALAYASLVVCYLLGTWAVLHAIWWTTPFAGQ